MGPNRGTAITGSEAAHWLVRNLSESLDAMASASPDYVEHQTRVSETSMWLSRPWHQFIEQFTPEAGLATNNYYVQIIRETIIWQNINWRALRDKYLNEYQLLSQYGVNASPEFRFMFKPRRTRSGMRAPLVWSHHYHALWESNFDCLMSPIVQNVVLGNEPGGETKPWRN